MSAVSEQMNEESDNLLADLASIEAIVIELPRIGNRSELKARAGEIIWLVEMMRRKVHLREAEKKKDQFIPNFAALWGGKKE